MTEATEEAPQPATKCADAAAAQQLVQQLPPSAPDITSSREPVGLPLSHQSAAARDLVMAAMPTINV